MVIRGDNAVLRPVGDEIQLNASRRNTLVSAIAYAPRQAGASEVDFNLDNGLDCDYACFALWDGTRAKQSEIVGDLTRRFELIGDYEIHWSKEHYNRNVSRLYEENKQPREFDGWNKKVGQPPFRFIIVRDNSPSYTWKRSVSGVIEPSNEKVVAAKYQYRSWFEKKYQVHSSNNLSEFLLQAALVLGVERTLEVVRAGKKCSAVLEKDLEGASGWASWDQLFSVLNFATNYLILRNFEGLPQHLEDNDVDFLCDNFQRLASAANVLQSVDRPFKGTMKVAGRQISVDIRFTGDGYYPAPWQVAMLQRRRLADGFFTPALDDLFFSIMYHCKIHKPKVKPAYISKLSNLAEQMRFDWFSADVLDNDAECTKALSGYMRSQAFFYEDAIDEGVYRNEKIIRGLPKKGFAKIVKPKKKRIKRAKERIRKQASRVRSFLFSPR
jgi:hypothetical protein